ncbi:uncharacterized protein JCM10292_000234 [Rhodotorula paludigena]|uniref:uncharacterized protein n=1 Tax=Rhodotorula paludigena TaxID=86838 RepID=UPI00317E9DB1
MSRAPTPTWAEGVGVTVSALSVIGGAGIAVGWWFAPQRSHLRQKLVLGLGVTDFVQAVTTLIGAALDAAGQPYETNSPSCTASGFVYQTCVLTNACWTLVIAIVTYTTLVYPFSRFTALLETRAAFPVIAALVVFVGITPSIPVTILYDMTNATGLCWLKPGTRSADLMLFVPRAATLSVVVILYVRLFWFFRRRDINIDTVTDPDEQETEIAGGKRLSLASLSTRLSPWHRRSSDTLHHPPPHNPRSSSLAPIPGSPVTFSQPFDPAASRGSKVDPKQSTIPPPAPDPRNVSRDHSTTVFEPTKSTMPAGVAPLHSFPDSRQHSVSVSFTGVEPPRSNSTASSIDPTQSHPSPHPPPTSPASGRSKRFSSVGWPGRLSFTATGERKRKRPLTPRQISKRLSLLMAVYPVAYSCLVAVSIARLIKQLSTGEAAAPGLAWTSRFLITSQGAIDGLLFVVVQSSFKRWMKREQG